MRTRHTRHAIVLGLTLATALTAFLLRPQVPESVMPAASALTSGTGWTVTDTYTSTALHYRQWQLRDSAGHEALLYVGISTRSVAALSWSGELGYQGAGFLVSQAGERQLVLTDRSVATVSTAHVTHLSDSLVVMSAIASPRGVLVHRLTSFPEAVWDAIGGDRGPFFLTRVSVPVGTSDSQASVQASNLLATVLPRLVADAQSP